MKNTFERLQEARVQIGDFVYLSYENEQNFLGRVTSFTNEVVILDNKTEIPANRPCQSLSVSLSKSYACRLQKNDHIHLGHISSELIVCGYNQIFGLRVKRSNNSTLRIRPSLLDERFMLSWQLDF